MGRKLIAVIVVVLIIIGVVYGLTRNNNSGSTTPPASSNNTSSQNSSTNNPPPSANQSSTNSVSIQNFAFNPADITVKKGTMVTWTNNDSTTHTVTETDSQAGPNSGDLNPGGKYSFTFNSTGTFHYHCSIHTEMTGTVTVTE